MSGPFWAATPTTERKDCMRPRARGNDRGPLRIARTPRIVLGAYSDFLPSARYVCGRRSDEPFPVLPRVINFKFLLQPHQKYNIAQYEELGFSQLTQMKDDYTTNSRYITTYISLLKAGRIYVLNLEMKLPAPSQPLSNSQVLDPSCNASRIEAWLLFKTQYLVVSEK